MQLSKGERSRSLLLDAACSLFVNQGYASTSMRQIAEGAGLALGGIYNHFASKEEIFRALLVERNPYPQIAPLIPNMETKSGADIDRSQIRILLGELGRHPKFFNLMLVEMVEFKGSHLPEFFENVLSGVPPPAWLRVFLGMFVSYHTTQSLLSGLSAPDTQEYSLDTFIDIFLYGILKSELVNEFSSAIDHT
jgi:AcrR family transcriptional regulator